MKLPYVFPDFELPSTDVAIVIPSAKLKEKEAGAEIDSRGCVVRFNNFVINDYEKWVGSKTDIHFAGAGQIKEGGQYKKILVEFQDQKYVNTVDATVQLLNIQVDIYKTFGLPLQFPPSTGLCAVYSIIKSGAKPNVYGFETDPYNYTYYDKDETWRPPVDINRHNFILEKQIIAKLAAQNLITLK